VTGWTRLRVRQALLKQQPGAWPRPRWRMLS